MIGMEDWVAIRNIKKKHPELGTRSIARLVGVSRSTVKRALNFDQYPRYQRDRSVKRVIEHFGE